MIIRFYANGSNNKNAGIGKSRPLLRFLHKPPPGCCGAGVDVRAGNYFHIFVECPAYCCGIIACS